MSVKKTKGAALILVVTIIAVFSILTISLLNVSLADKRHAVRYDRNSQANYIARSGISVGLKALDDRLSAKITEVSLDPTKTITVDTLVTAANTYALSNLTNKDFQNEYGVSAGKYTVKYEKFSASEIKIICDSKIEGNTFYQDKATLIVSVKTGSNFHQNPDEWLNGGSQTLTPGVTTNNYLDDAVKLIGKGNAIKIPSNGNRDSFYKAQIIYFTDEKGVSFSQINNVIEVAFDAEIILFETAVVTNDLTGNKEATTSDPVYLTLSDDIINAREDGGAVIAASGFDYGFENYNRYKAFIGTETVDNWNTYYKDLFTGTGHYGLVRFGGGIRDSKNTYVNYDGQKLEGYYFFRSGVNLHAINPGDFIKIKSDDAILKVLDNYVHPSINRSGRVWNDV